MFVSKKRFEGLRAAHNELVKEFNTLAEKHNILSKRVDGKADKLSAAEGKAVRRFFKDVVNRKATDIF